MPETEVLTEPLLDAAEAAKLLKVPRSTLYELVRSRGLPHVRVGERGLRFTRSDLAAWVAQNTYGFAASRVRSASDGRSRRNASDTRLAASSRSTKAR
jgi:excisionase family DNA binding protein